MLCEEELFDHNLWVGRNQKFSAEPDRWFGVLIGAKVRLPRPTNCANAPWWFSSLFLLCEEETRTGRHFLNAGRLSESAGEQMSEAENFLLPEQVVWGLVGGESTLASSYQLC